MKRILLLAIYFLTVTFGFSQTETITIDWDFFSVPASDPNSMFDTEITIEVGDTVEWVWQGSNFHNLKSIEGQSVETFGTPDETEGDNTTYTSPYTYSYTFTVEGVNDFECTPHSSLMYGSVTVVAEGTLSVSSFEATSFSISPNPAKSYFTLDLETFTNNSTIEVYDVLGKKVVNRKVNAMSSTFDVSNWNSGLYIIKVSSENSVLMKRFVKQ
ncbi:MAG: plastocyanin [Glaciecola sp.]|jgi:plastocyanin